MVALSGENLRADLSASLPSVSKPIVWIMESTNRYLSAAFFGYSGQLRSADTMFPLLFSDQRS
jgi:hypothetical protein